MRVPVRAGSRTKHKMASSGNKKRNTLIFPTLDMSNIDITTKGGTSVKRFWPPSCSSHISCSYYLGKRYFIGDCFPTVLQ